MSALPEPVRSWIGQTLVSAADGPEAHPSLWEVFCAAIEDGNPLYWDDAAAAPHVRARIAPPSMLAAWVTGPEWFPRRTETGCRPLEAHFMVKDALGYPNGIVIEAEFAFHEPVRAGDKLRAEQRLLSVGEEKHTRLGLGREWSIAVSFTNQNDQCVGEQTFRFLGYRAE